MCDESQRDHDRILHNPSIKDTMDENNEMGIFSKISYAVDRGIGPGGISSHAGDSEVGATMSSNSSNVTNKGYNKTKHGSSTRMKQINNYSSNTVAEGRDFGTGIVINRNDNSEDSSSDHDFLNEVGYTFTLSDKLLGHGSYGDVYLATDETGKNLAVKCCKIDVSGIPNILEASIMGSMVHPYLNRALRVQATDTKLYIIQELARTDLAEHTRRGKGNHKPSIEELRKWCFSVAQGVQALHSQDIIHADIKASNVLLYSDGSVRLTDYTLATKKWSSNEKFTHNVCTCTHRPLECLMRKSWDSSLDIWSLGCTFYEIAYGELLFPYQGAMEQNISRYRPPNKNHNNINRPLDQKNLKDLEESRAKAREAKTRLRNRSINAIIDWASRGPIPSPDILGATLNSLDFIPFSLCSDYKNPEMKLFNDLLCNMLVVDPAKRPTITEVLSHPFFKDMHAPVYLSIHRPVNRIPVSEQARVTRYIQRYTSNETAQSLAMNLYCRCNDLDTISEHIKAAACTWISSKIVIGYPPSISLPPHQLLSAERDICHNLKFRLHSL